MSNNLDVHDQAYQFFIEEVPELLQSIEAGLFSLTQEFSHNNIHEVMRAAHSIKGGAAMVELDAIKTIAHRLEDSFRALFNEDVEWGSDLENLLFQGFDCLRSPLLDQLETGEFDQESALANAELVFQNLETQLGDALAQVDNYVPSSSNTGFDMVASIFEVDVQQGIERLEAVRTHPEQFEVMGELRAQAEVFVGFAELFKLPGFGAISATAITAAEHHPHEILTIIQLAIDDLRLSRASVLEGDRQQGGNPCDRLIELAGGLQDTLVEPIQTDLLGDDGSTDNQVFDDGDGFEGGGVFDSGDVFDDVDVFDDSAVFQSGAVFGGSAALAPSDLSEDSAIFRGGDVFGGSEAFEGSDISEHGDVFEGSETFEGSAVFEQGGLFLNREDVEAAAGFEGGNILEQSEVFDSGAVTENNGAVDHSTTLEQDIAFTGGDVLELSEGIEREGDDVLDPSEGFQREGDGVLELSEGLEREGDGVTSDEVTSDEVTDDEVSENFAHSSDGSASVAIASETVFATTPETDAPIGLAHDTTPDDNPSVVASDETASDTSSKFPSQADFEAKSRQFLERLAAQTPSSSRKSTRSSSSKVVSATPTSLSVRVDMNRLERMSNVVGELTINRNGLALQNEGLQRTVKDLTGRVEHLSEIVRNVQVVRAKMAAVLPMDSPTMMKKPAPAQTEADEEDTMPVSVPAGESLEDAAAFDPLEMDRYSVLDSYLQALLEESAQIEEVVGDAELFAKQSNQDLLKHRQMLRQMRDEVMWSRMFPLGNVLNRFPRMIRELSSTYQKPVNLKLLGVGVLIDKAILEKLYDPIFHLIRNAFAHGIETADERRQANKSEQGLIEVQAYHQGNETVIEIRDDGKGIDLQAIAEKAIEKGIVTLDEITAMSETQLTELIFSPGFSTAHQVDSLSGRGVGLDVVRSRIQELKGSLTLETELHKGTTFMLRLPFTLTLAKLLIATAGSSMLSFYSDSIEEIVVPRQDNIKESGGRRFLYRGEQLIQIYTLRELVSYSYGQMSPAKTSGLRPLKTPKDWEYPLLMLRRGQQLVALEIDQLVTEQELVIKPFGTAIAPPSYCYGCTIFGDGTLIPVVDGLSLIEYSTGDAQHSGMAIVSPSPEQPDTAPEPVITPTILIVDDSTAFRRTLALSLEKAGYLVVQARDGQEGLDQLKSRTDIKLVICDVEMPNMNGFEFLGKRRTDDAMASIPVAMLTSRSNDKHRQLATQLGANHYFTKPYIAREFLGTIASLIEN